MNMPKRCKPTMARPDTVHLAWTGSGRAVVGFDFPMKKNLFLALSCSTLLPDTICKAKFKDWERNMQVHFTNCMYGKVIFIGRVKIIR